MAAPEFGTHGRSTVGISSFANGGLGERGLSSAAAEAQASLFGIYLEMWTGLPKLYLMVSSSLFWVNSKFGKVFAFGCALDQDFARLRIDLCRANERASSARP